MPTGHVNGSQITLAITPATRPAALARRDPKRKQVSPTKTLTIIAYKPFYPVAGIKGLSSVRRE